MAISREKKEAVVAKVSDSLAQAGSAVFVHFKGLSVADTTSMRRALREAGVGYTVAKKRLIRRALETQSIEGEMPALEGEIAVAYGEDLVAPAREVHNFAKGRTEQLSIVGGVFEGKYMNAAQMMEIATIPSRETLYAQFVMLINSPIQQFAMAVNEIAKAKEA